jgi:hypothetical protein
MDIVQQLPADLESNTQTLLAWADGLSPEQLQQRPAPGKWSVAEVLEHIFIVEKGAAKMARVESEVVERDLARSRDRMARGMADLNQAFSGGSIVDPKGRFADYAEWRAAFVANRAELVQISSEKGWMGLLMMFPHPYFGHLTRAEWIIVGVLHADRHLAQMQGYVN